MKDETMKDNNVKESTMKELTPTTKGKLTRLANLKVEAKALEEEIKKLQDQVFEELGNDAPSKWPTKNGKSLCKSHRENWSKPSNEAALEVLGKALFLKHASITKSQVAKAGGEAAVQELVDRGELELNSVSVFYALKSKC